MNLGRGDWGLLSEAEQWMACALYDAGVYGSCIYVPPGGWVDKAAHVSSDTHSRRPELTKRRASFGRDRHEPRECFTPPAIFPGAFVPSRRRVDESLRFVLRFRYGCAPGPVVDSTGRMLVAEARAVLGVPAADEEGIGVKGKAMLHLSFGIV